jgi:site-specific DNA recombinase
LKERLNAIYVRVSTEEQAREGMSIDTQLDKLMAYADFQGWDNLVPFVDEGESAKDMNRPAMKRLIELVKKGQVARVVTMTVDRLSRNLLDMLNFIELCETHNTAYVCVSLNFDTSTPIGRMVLQILAAFAEFERAMIASRVKVNMAQIVTKKKKYLAAPPFGYQFDSEGKLVIVPEEAEWIRKAADMFISGHGYRSIAAFLNNSGLRTRKDKPWSASTVRNMLTSELYIGKIIWNRRYYDKKGKMKWRDDSDWVIAENAHEPILNDEQWKEIQNRITRRMPRGGEKQMKHRLSGLLVCGHCGHKMVARRYGSKGPNKDRMIFVCSQYQKNGGCRFNYIFEEEAEQEVYTTIEEFAGGMINLKIEDLEAATTALLEEFARREALIDQKFQRQIQAYENGLISDRDLKIARERVEREREFLEKEKARALSGPPGTSALEKTIGPEARKLLWLWNNGELPVIQNTLRTILDSITVKDRKIQEIFLSRVLFES